MQLEWFPPAFLVGLAIASGLLGVAVGLEWQRWCDRGERRQWRIDRMRWRLLDEQAEESSNQLRVLFSHYQQQALDAEERASTAEMQHPSPLLPASFTSGVYRSVN